MGALAFTRRPQVAFNQTASATVANTTTETTILSTGSGSKDIAANSLAAGHLIRLTLSGHYGTDATPHTLQIRVKLDTTTIVDTGAQTVTGSLTSRGWELVATIAVRTIGATGTVFGQGAFRPATTALAASSWDMETTATVTVDTTQVLTLNVTAQWGAGVTASDTITCTNAVMEVLSA